MDTSTALTRQKNFFLVINPDNRTYAALSEACILTAEEGVYSYRALIPPSRLFPRISYVNKPLEFMSSMQVEEFEETLRAEIAKGAK